MTEQQLQTVCFILHWNKKPHERGLLYMNHNNPKDARHGAQLKAMGMIAGVADMTYLGNGFAHFLEFKTEKGKQTAKQKEWQEIVEYAGFRYTIIRNLQDFKKVTGC